MVLWQRSNGTSIGMRMSLIALAIVAAIVSLGGVIGCGETLPTIKTVFSSPAVSVAETVRVTDAPQVIFSPVIMVVETIGIDDLSRVTSPLVIKVVEAIVVSDTPRVLPLALIRVTEAIGVDDSSTLTPRPVTKTAVMVTSPKTGEGLRAGIAQSVVWATTGDSIAYVDVYYSTDGGKSMISVARNETNDGIYTWKVPNTPSKTVLVRVLAFNVKGEMLAFGDSGLFIISIQ